MQLNNDFAYIGHKSEDGRIQTLKDHLSGVAEISEEFAKLFEAGKHAYRTGILHDAGKYSRAGQSRMNDPEHTAKVDHSTAGAKIAFAQLHDHYAACAIAGHHGGMPDLGNRTSAEGDGTVCGRCMKDLSGNLDASKFWKENQVSNDKLWPNWLQTDRKFFAHQFYTRMNRSF